jgi:CBS domain-containing protein
MLGGEDFKKMTASHVMQTDVYYFFEETPIIDILSAITMGGFGSVPITTEKEVVVGIISEYDILNAIGFGKNLSKTLAREIMTKDPVGVGEDVPVEKIMALLQAKHLIRVPIVNREGVLVGVVARRDILLGYLRSVESPPRMVCNLL